MRFVYRLAVAGLLGSVLAGPASAADARSKVQDSGLDEQVQDVKSDVLAIATELGRLEEKLLYPSSTEVSLFVSLAKTKGFRLDAVSILLDGKEVAHHLYNFQELEALRKGAVQRIYTGNAVTGAHTLDVSVLGKSEAGEDYQKTVSASISKDIGPRLVEIELTEPASSGPGIDIKEW